MPGAIVTAYAWNSSAIDSTDIPRSVIAFGGKFIFPLDIDNTQPFTLTLSHDTAIAQYLHHVSNHRQFATDLLKYLIEDRRTAHRERINLSRQPNVFQKGDIVTVRV